MMQIQLNNRIMIPQIGIGVFTMTPEECERVVSEAMKTGYRLIDTANSYRNEKAMGRAVKKSGISREEIVVTTKLWPTDYKYGKAKRQIEATLKRLDTDYIDILLLHQPYGEYLDAWRAMEEAIAEGKVKAIGLSNFDILRLKDVIEHATIKPSVIQLECHPYFQQKELKKFVKEHDIKLEAWYPLGHGNKKLLNDTVFTKLASKYDKSNVQIILKWHVQSGHIIIPATRNSKHMVEKLELYNFELTNDEMQQINNLDKNKGYFNMPEFMKKFMFTKMKMDFENQK